MPDKKTNNTDVNASKLLTVKDVARLDQCYETTVRRAIEAELLEVIRIGPGLRMIKIDPASHAKYREKFGLASL